LRVMNFIFWGTLKSRERDWDWLFFFC